MVSLWFCYALMTILSLVYVLLVPFTKVEESFNMQAIHDLLFISELSEFDHFEFPGVVPRTFVGPLLLYLPLWPIAKIISTLGLSKFLLQYFARMWLGLYVCGSLIIFLETIRQRLHVGKSVLIWTALITCSQFHTLFYSTRSLPNIFALIFCLLAFSFWLRCDFYSFIYLSFLGIIVFRFELALILGPLGLVLLLARVKATKNSVSAMIRYIFSAICIGLIILAITIWVDSVFWKKILWPEGQVFYFNAILNRSSEWGTSPFLWYFYSALPRALLCSLPFAVIGCLFSRDCPRQCRILGASAAAFVLAFSFLGHKELRFIIHTFPVFNLLAGFGCQYVWVLSTKMPSSLRTLLRAGIVGHLVVNVIATFVFCYTARLNYPGGNALFGLHQHLEGVIAPLTTEHPLGHRGKLHIDVFSAQTGVTRFGQTRPDLLIYDKTEGLKVHELVAFDFHLIEAQSPECMALRMSGNYHTLFEIDGLSKIKFNGFVFPPISVEVDPQVVALRHVNYTAMSRDVLRMLGA